MRRSDPSGSQRPRSRVFRPYPFDSDTKASFPITIVIFFDRETTLFGKPIGEFSRKTGKGGPMRCPETWEKLNEPK